MERPSTTLHAAAVDGDASGVVVAAEAYTFAQCDSHGGNAVHMGLAKLRKKRLINSLALLHSALFHRAAEVWECRRLVQLL
jgi:hypothetical protein